MIEEPSKMVDKIWRVTLKAIEVLFLLCFWLLIASLLILGVLSGISYLVELI